MGERTIEYLLSYFNGEVDLVLGWEAFDELEVGATLYTFCTGNTRKTLNEWDKVSRSLSHKPFNTKVEKHQRFLHQTLEKLLNLKDRLDVEQEINQVKAQIN